MFRFKRRRIDKLKEEIKEELTQENDTIEEIVVAGEPAIIMSKNRLEALSDAVFAIVMTLLTIEIKVPTFEGFHYLPNNAELFDKLKEITPLFSAYFLSFAVLSMFWLSHHFLFHAHAKNIDRVLILLNMIYLCFLAIIPFTSQLLGEYIHSSLATTIYGLNLMCVALLNLAMYYYAWHVEHIENGVLSFRVKRQTSLRVFTTIMCLGIGILCGPISTYLSMAFYLIPVILGNIPGLLTFILERVLHINID